MPPEPALERQSRPYVRAERTSRCSSKEGEQVDAAATAVPAAPAVPSTPGTARSGKNMPPRATQERQAAVQPTAAL